MELLLLKFLRSLGKLASENMRFVSKQRFHVLASAFFYLISFRFVLPIFPDSSLHKTCFQFGYQLSLNN